MASASGVIGRSASAAGSAASGLKRFAKEKTQTISQAVGMASKVKLTDRQEGELMACFDSFDVDGSGTLDAKEAARALRMIGICNSEDEITRTIERMDQGGNGTIEKQEFVDFMANELTAARHMNVEIEMAFEMLVRFCSTDRVAEMKRRLRASVHVFDSPLTGGGGGGGGGGLASAGRSPTMAAALSPTSKWHTMRNVNAAVEAAKAAASSQSPVSSTATPQHERSSSQKRLTKKEKAESAEEKRARSMIFRMGTQELFPEDKDKGGYPGAPGASDEAIYLDTQYLRLILTDAGNPLSDDDMDVFLSAIDPGETGIVQLSALKGMECFSGATAAPPSPSSPGAAPSPSSSSPGGGGAAPVANPDPSLLYATVPDGVKPGDVLGVEAPNGSIVTATVPDGCFPGATFAISGALSAAPAAASSSSQSSSSGGGGGRLSRRTASFSKSVDTSKSREGSSSSGGGGSGSSNALQGSLLLDAAAVTLLESVQGEQLAELTSTSSSRTRLEAALDDGMSSIAPESQPQSGNVSPLEEEVVVQATSVSGSPVRRTLSGPR